MSKQYNKVVKRRRGAAFEERKKERLKALRLEAKAAARKA